MPATPSKRRTPERRFSILRAANAVVKSELEARLYFASQSMFDINSEPRSYTIEEKMGIADELNWACGMVFPIQQIPGRYVLAKYRDQKETDYIIKLIPNDDDQT